MKSPMHSWRFFVAVVTMVALCGTTRGEDAVTSAPQAVGIEEAKPIDDAVEIVRQRRPDGTVEIERQVTQDDEGNYINHGTWKQYDTENKVIAEGKYDKNQRHGTWMRQFTAADTKLCGEEPYRSFKGPFVSEATLNRGKLHGSWVIYDSEKSKVSEIEFADGKRHGKAVWLYPNGKTMQVSSFVDGVIDGELTRYDTDGNVTATEIYQDGRKVESQVDYYENKQKKSEAKYLHPRLVIATPDDSWNVALATFAAQGKAMQHGAWTAWHENGQKMEQGTFDFGQRVGKFVAWHANGQKASEGSYVSGKQHGRWVWWHPNGQKQTDGHYSNGRRSGEWAWWNAAGRIEEKTSLITPTQERVNAGVDSAERTSRRASTER